MTNPDQVTDTVKRIHYGLSTEQISALVGYGAEEVLEELKECGVIRNEGGLWCVNGDKNSRPRLVENVAA